ncbi:AAA family ATPase [Haloparvum alkalitolerans]|uniref:AAA family ATPase n=1 Tax=Haloparvum alkalitolerans TaxID=1042953 RepID=UPI003CF7A891
MTGTTLALVGATGGAGTTRTAVELAAMGARTGENVAVLDAAYATQGLSEYVSGRIDPDLTALVTDERERPLADAAHGAGDALPGNVTFVPARAPFERVARAKTAAAARALSDRIGAAAAEHDRVIVDTPPVAANQAVAAVTETDRVAGVRPASRHGRDALQRLRGRLDDVGSGLDATLAVDRFGDGGEAAATDRGADATLPATDPTVAAAPVAGTDDGAYGEAVAAGFEAAFDASLEVSFEDEGLLDRIGN